MPGKHMAFVLLLLILIATVIPAKAQNDSKVKAKAVVIVFPDGWMDITLTLNLTGNESLINVKIDGEPHYLLVEGEGWLLLNHTLSGNILSIETLGAKQINVSYQTPSLTSKIGSLWNASINLDVSSLILLLPKDSIILGMSSVPDSIQARDQWMELSFSTGSLWVTYKIERAPVTPPTLTASELKVSESVTKEVPAALSSNESSIKLQGSTSRTGTKTSIPIINSSTNLNLVSKNLKLSSSLIFILIISAIIAILAISLVRRHGSTKISRSELDSLEESIISELVRRNGQALQSDLVKALDVPRATVWRRLRRMESEGKVELLKEGRYTLVRLKANIDDLNS